MESNLSSLNQHYKSFINEIQKFWDNNEKEDT